MLTGVLSGEWQTFRGCAEVTVTLLRDGASVASPVTYDLGPATSRFFDGSIKGWNVRSGDSLRVELANSSGQTQTLTSERFVGEILGTTSSALTVAEEMDTSSPTSSESTGPDLLTVPSSTEDGDLLSVIVMASVTNGRGYKTWDWESVSGCTLVGESEGFASQRSMWVLQRRADGDTPGANLGLPDLGSSGDVSSWGRTSSCVRLPQAQVQVADGMTTFDSVTSVSAAPTGSGGRR